MKVILKLLFLLKPTEINVRYLVTVTKLIKILQLYDSQFGKLIFICFIYIYKKK